MKKVKTIRDRIRERKRAARPQPPIPPAHDQDDEPGEPTDGEMEFYRTREAARAKPPPGDAAASPASGTAVSQGARAGAAGNPHTSNGKADTNGRKPPGQ